MDIVVLCAGVALGLTLLAPAAWLVLLTDGLLAGAVIAGAIGWGAWPVVWLGFGRRGPLVQVCIAAALGLGWLSTATLTLGVAGALSQPVAWGLLAAGGLCGLVRLSCAQAAPDAQSTEAPGAADRVDRGWHVAAALVLAVPLVVALLGATLPPGVLWPEEAFGYDVLEYHLEVPREYFEAGRISFLPHNVYAAFPQQMEMLYLLLMYQAGDAHAAAIPAQLVHVGCGVLAVLALGALLPARRGFVLAALAAGATPWLAYLGALAYVENGMVFFAAVAGGLALEACRAERGPVDWRLVLTVGLCAGLAGACKYTAVALVVAALGVAWMAAMRATWTLRGRSAALYALGALLALSPWLIRNATQAGNPVYPFAYGWFGGKAWSDAQAAQWARAHRVAAEFDSPIGRVRLGVRELFGRFDQASGGLVPSLFGPAVFLAGLGGLVTARGRGRSMLLIWSGLILAGWLAFTFVPGRFAVGLVVPLALLGGMGTIGANARTGEVSRVMSAAVLIGALAGDAILLGRYRAAASGFQRQRGAPLVAAVGQTAAFVRFHPLNEALPEDATVWLVGEARAYYIIRHVHYWVVFNRDPWIAMAQRGAPPAACVQWLRAQGVTHVALAWSEIARLRRTYGFSPVVTRRWVRRLEAAGLERIGPGDGRNEGMYEIYRVGAARSVQGTTQSAE